MNEKGLLGVGTTDENGVHIDIIRIPPRFLSKDATQEEKTMYNDLIEVVRKLNNKKNNQMNTEVKICRDCKHKVHYFTKYSWNCAYDQTKNVVTGDVVQPIQCSFNRSLEGACKPEGILFQQKPVVVEVEPEVKPEVKVDDAPKEDYSGCMWINKPYEPPKNLGSFTEGSNVVKISLFGKLKELFKW